MEKQKKAIALTVQIKAAFYVIPEIPLIGTADASIAIMLGLTIFRVKRKQP